MGGGGGLSQALIINGKYLQGCAVPISVYL